MSHVNGKGDRGNESELRAVINIIETAFLNVMVLDNYA